MNAFQEKVLALKKKKKALILAHYYQTMDIQDIADHVCDSFEMARRARDADEELLIICGVRFMAESAKILNPSKTVLLPSTDAGCPMADMIEPEDVLKLRLQHPDAAVVCYVNSSAALKAVSDVCCTSSSAEKIVRAVPERRVIFIPDRNLGSYIAKRVPEKEITIYDGCCPVHDRITSADAANAKSNFPGAKLLAHPECREDVLAQADFIGSTAEIIREALNSGEPEFIIATEEGVAERLKTLAPGKAFHTVKSGFICADMKKLTLQDVLGSLESGDYEVLLSAPEIAAASKSLERMVELG